MSLQPCVTGAASLSCSSGCFDEVDWRENRDRSNMFTQKQSRKLSPIHRQEMIINVMKALISAATA
jgi:hypothetical protein